MLLLRRRSAVLFIEHARVDDERLARWQDRLNGLQTRLGHTTVSIPGRSGCWLLAPLVGEPSMPTRCNGLPNRRTDNPVDPDQLTL
jgi:hypothetical protein